MKSRSYLMLEKSVAAVLSAIEIYNKPDFKYREELFSVLCINAWELLFKAKVLNLASNKVASLYVMEFKTLKDGKKSKIPRPKTNRSGTPQSISLFEAYRVITEEYGVKVEASVIDNITTITEIRDNSIHFVNNDLYISLKVQELGTASLQNYLYLTKEWFGDILSGYNFYLMPLSFFRDFDTAKGITLNKNENKILGYIKQIEEKYDSDEDVRTCNLTLKIDVKFQKVNSKTGNEYQLTNDPTAPTIRVTEEEINDKYPWVYEVLTTRLSKRYSDFKINKKYHQLRSSLSKDKRFAYIRIFNPKKPEGAQMILFNPNIIKEFDKHYTKLTM
jgi:translation elongation factor P/translation initiation factor 5A